jgi:hypothetical protein
MPPCSPHPGQLRAACRWPAAPRPAPVCRAPGSGATPSSAANCASRAGSGAERLLQRRQGQARTGDVGEQATETDGHQQQGLKALVDGQIEQQQADRHHHRLPASSWASPEAPQSCATRSIRRRCQFQQRITHRDRVTGAHGDRLHTVPSRGARTSVSIFMASRITQHVPGSHVFPRRHRDAHDVAGQGRRDRLPAHGRRRGRSGRRRLRRSGSPRR